MKMPRILETEEARTKRREHMAATTRGILQSQMTELEAEKAALEKELEPLERRKQAAFERSEAALAEAAAINEKIKAIRDPHMGNLSADIARLAKAMGARSTLAPVNNTNTVGELPSAAVPAELLTAAPKAATDGDA